MPQSWTPSTKRIVVMAMVLVAIFIIYLARTILTPLVLGGLLALILSPLIEILHRRLRFPRGLAVAVAYLVFVGAIVLGPVLFIPALARSAAALDVPVIIAEVTEYAVRTLESLRNLEVFGYAVDVSSSVDPLIETLTTGGEGGLDIDFGMVFGGAWAVTSAVFSGVIAFLTSTLLALVISIYLSASADQRTRRRWYELLPPAYIPEARILGERISRVWTDYLRGQLTVALVVGALTSLILFALGVPGALVLGVIGGLFNIIPTFGPIFAGVISAVVALVQGSYRFDIGNVLFALIVVGAYVLIQQLESSVITPRILGGAMAVSPLAILVGILVGFSAAGVLGAVVAVPVVATGREVFRYARAKLADEDPYPEGRPAPRPTLRDRWEKVRPGNDAGDDADTAGVDTDPSSAPATSEETAAAARPDGEGGQQQHL